MRVRVYVKPEPTSKREPECRQCIMTEKVLTDKKVGYERFILTDEVTAEIKAMTGFLSAPVVLVGEGSLVTDSWAGFRPDKLNELASLIQQ